jgi:hypothetical protein
MPHINVELSVGLLKAMKLRCVESGERQKHFVVRILEEACYGEVRVYGGDVGEGQVQGRGLQEMRGEREGNVVAHIGKPSRKEKACKEDERPGWCGRHSRKMRDFGTKWMCDGPPEHSTSK